MAMHPADATYRNTILRISDLVVTEDTLRGLTFENCQLIGPAVLVPLGESELNGCTFDGDFDSFVWPISPERGHILGAIGLINCNLFGCRLTRIGLGVPEPFIEEVRAQFNA